MSGESESSMAKWNYVFENKDEEPPRQGDLVLCEPNGQGGPVFVLRVVHAGEGDAPTLLECVRHVRAWEDYTERMQEALFNNCKFVNPL